MKLLDRYEFTNGKVFESYLLEAADIARYNVPECDVIGLRRVGDDNDLMSVMRPDEALIQARMLIAAVDKVTSGYEIGLKQSQSTGTTPDLDGLYPKYNCPACGDWFHMPWKFCKCVQESKPLAMELVDDLKEMDHAATKES